MQHCIFQHPPAQISAHPFIPITGVQKSSFKFLQLCKGVGRTSSPDPAEELVHIEIRQRNGDRMIMSLSNLRAPGKIPPKQPDIQIMIRRKILMKASVPRCIILIVLHELPLPVKIPAFVLIGITAIFIEVHHFKDPVRHIPEDRLPLRHIPGDRLPLRHIPEDALCLLPVQRMLFSAWLLFRPPAFCPQRKRCIMIDPLIGGRRFLQDDRIASALLRSNRQVQKMTHHFLPCFLPKAYADPLLPLHPERSGNVRFPEESDCLHSTLDIALLNLDSQIKVPLAHQKSDPLPRRGLRENRKPGEFRPLMLLMHPILFFGVSCQLC